MAGGHNEDECPETFNCLSQDEKKNVSEDRERKQKKNNKMDWLTLETLAIVFASLSLVFTMITLIVTGIQVSGGPGDGQDHQNGKDSFFDTGPACVTCNKLVNYQNGQEVKNPLLDQLTNKIKKNVEMCCAEDWEQLAVLFSMVVEKLRKKQENPGNNNLFKFSPATAHKSLIFDERETQFFNHPKPAKLNQTYNNRLTEHVRGLEVAEDGFVIPYSGYYYVYASLLFKPNSTWLANAPRSSIPSGFIGVKSPRRPNHSGSLTKMSHHPCQNCKEDEESLFSGGAFKLKAGDKIEVYLTGPGLVETNEDSSYLGLVMLASENQT